MAFENQILTVKSNKIVLTKGVEGIKVGEIEIKAVKKFKCPLQTFITDDYEYHKPFFEADPGKYIIETE